MNTFEDEVSVLEQRISAPNKQGVVFYGSSSIRQWASLADDFLHISPLNLGFGGSTLAACTWHFDRLIVPLQPRLIVFYAGDNDLNEGRQPEEVYLFFCALTRKIQQQLPQTALVYISIKPSPARWGIVEHIRRANELIAREIDQLPAFQYVDITSVMLTDKGEPRRELYEPDGLHLNRAGYTLWQQELQRQVPALLSD